MCAKRDRIKPKNKLVVPNAWVSRDSERSTVRFRTLKVILKYAKLYCRYSSLNGFKYLADSRRPWFERILWVIIYCITISSLIFIVYYSYEEFLMSPTITSMDTDHYPTTELNFPGIAICSVNRISRKAATVLANEISRSNVTDLPFDEILSLIKELGNLYASEFEMDANGNIAIHQLLTAYHKGDYDIGEIMKKLSPQCSIMLLVCKLHGNKENCSEIFTMRKTQDGYCCTFNYVRESDDIPVMNDAVLKPLEVRKVFDLGIERGLTVVMEPSLKDYFYTILPVTGWRIIVFNPHDFPDGSSGGVTEVLAMPQTETYVDVTAASFFSTSYVERFPREKRKCIFAKETQTKYGGTLYTYSDCIVDCKANEMYKLCGCRPFFYPRRGNEYSLRVCTNADLECLGKHKSKWWTVIPHHITDLVLTDKEALNCYNCYPACEDLKYEVLSSKSYMAPGLYRTDLLRNFTITHQGIVHVYFSQYGSISLRQDEAYRWYELMSDMGGICGVFIGFSFISLVEFTYFVAMAIRDLLCKQPVVENDSDEDETPNETIWTIHWSELMPRSWQSANYRHPGNKGKY